ncbi:mitochondrial isocitrate dehydrogenase (NAD+) [Andalucia godoyi]|uniref:Mitochondrial isocitrate dehydrogenase (NAD+) n=1 Tax=Andalucia godoyi TaxID=505711 RepID=A0A8K0F0X2_ANDGO|nr:mitochondrial isocitrate dehydrogenase (NAD+) [Andalucia godoyi]|eukprot:ANDGO_08525.mRNA.1 mitochondrial isocitrate dehydrogenase (NAD+)
MISRRLFSTAVAAGSRTVTLFPGDGIGREISSALQKVFTAASVPVVWDTYDVGAEAAERTGSLITKEALDSVLRTGVCLKGPTATPIGKGHKSLNVTLRQTLDIYANVRPAKTIAAVPTRYEKVDIVIVRENTEDLYAGQEAVITDGVNISLKIITEKASTRIAKYAFEYAVANGRKKVSAIHKANIMKLTDGLFLECCRKVAKEYPQITYDERIIDATCMMLVQDPTKFDVMVLPNLYGDIVSDLAAGLIGGLGLTASSNYGQKAVLFEAVHGTAPDIAGKDLANPSALLFSGAMMLRHLGLKTHADQIENAVLKTLKGSVKTKDLGGNSTCSEFTNHVIKNL